MIFDLNNWKINDGKMHLEFIFLNGIVNVKRALAPVKRTLNSVKTNLLEIADY